VLDRWTEQKFEYTYTAVKHKKKLMTHEHFFVSWLRNEIHDDATDVWYFGRVVKLLKTIMTKRYSNGLMWIYFDTPFNWY